MAWPSDLVRTKNWGTEVLTDSDLEGQFDLIINWVMATMSSTTGHDHSASANKSQKVSAATGLLIASQAQGDVLYASSASAFARLAAGTAGQALTTGGAAANPAWAGMTTQGDVEYHNGTTRMRLAAGTAAQALVTGGAGANPSFAGMTTDGDIEYRSAGARTRLAKGTALQLLRMNSGATAPEWASKGWAWEFVETLTASAVNSVTSSTLPTDADEFMLVFADVNTTFSGTLILRYNAVTTSYQTQVVLLNTLSTHGTTSGWIISETQANSTNLHGTIHFSRLNTNTGVYTSGPAFNVGSTRPDADKIGLRGFNSGAAATWTTFTIMMVNGTDTYTGKFHLFKLTKQ